MNNYLSTLATNGKELAERAKVEAYLKKRRLIFTTPHPSQIKVGHLNFYPGRGTIIADGEARRHEYKGAQAFIDLIEKLQPSTP